MRSDVLSMARSCTRLLVPALMLQVAQVAGAQAEPQRVTFPSADGRTELVGYVFAPSQPAGARHPAIVMMHGRAGAYSTRARGVYDATTLTLRHKAWGEHWAAEGFVAVLVDGFGPRGYAQGFPRFSYEQRPEELNEVTVRPLDAYGALAYLRTRADVAGERIGLMGWSNGGSATLASMAAETASAQSRQGQFRAAVALYAGCRLKGAFDKQGYVPAAPVLVLHGTADEEVAAEHCQRLVERSKRQGGDIAIRLYPGATHSFDDPGRRRQDDPANAAATKDAVPRTTQFMRRYLEADGRR